MLDRLATSKTLLVQDFSLEPSKNFFELFQKHQATNSVTFARKQCFWTWPNSICCTANFYSFKTIKHCLSNIWNLYVKPHRETLLVKHFLVAWRMLLTSPKHYPANFVYQGISCDVAKHSNIVCQHWKFTCQIKCVWPSCQTFFGCVKDVSDLSKTLPSKFRLSVNVVWRGQTFKHCLISKFQMFDKQCLIFWPGPYGNHVET